MAARPRAVSLWPEPSPSTLSGSSTAPLDSISLYAPPTAAPTVPVQSHDRAQVVLRGARSAEEDGPDSADANRRGGKRKRRERIPEERFVHVKRDELGWTRYLEERQWQLPHAQGYPNCNYQDNSVFTCYPESNTTLVQGDYSLVIWNAMQPSFINRQAVDIYLYNADTQDVATSWTNEPNAQGMIGIVPSDPWWPGPQSAQEWFGAEAQNRTTPYFFVVVPAGSSLTGGEVHGATFRAIQTAAPSSLSSTLAALSSSSLSSQSSVSASSASAASASSVASSRAASPSGSGKNGSGALQNDSDSSPRVPNWGIALIVILGVLALVAGAAAVFLCLGRARKRRRAQAEAGEAAVATAAGAGTDRSYYDDDDHTQGSADPILGGGGAAAASSSIGGASRMRSVGSGSSLAPALVGSAAGVGAGAGLGALAARRRDSHEGAIDRHDDGTTLSTSDAARMAEAFRAALRKSPFNLGGGAASIAAAGGAARAGLAAAEEGGSSRPPGPSPTGAEKGDDSHGSSGDSSAIGLGAGRDLLVNELQGEGKSMKDVEGGGGKRWGSR